MKKPELLAPIQDFTSLQAAIQAGADAVYFGIRGFNMRASAKNFEVKDLRKIVKIASEKKVETYLALNTIIYENELKKVERILQSAKMAKIDAIICWDMSVVQMARKLGLEIHLSTQASVSNSRAAEFYMQQGVSRIVLARECSLADIKKIKKKLGKLEIETFIHGAMCVSVSGRCFMSQYLYGQSANRGECMQPCRRKYLISLPSDPDFVGATSPQAGHAQSCTLWRAGEENARHDLTLSHGQGRIVRAKDGNEELELGEDYVLSPKDICTLPFIDKLIEAGIDVFKIEGRNRSPEYVKIVTSVYRRAIDFYSKAQNTISKIQKRKLLIKFENLKKELREELETVYNRGFGKGFYLGKPMNEWTHNYGNQATSKKIHIGKIVKFYPKISVAEIEIQANKILRVGDRLMIQGPASGVVEQRVGSMEIEHKRIKKATQGDLVAVKLDETVRANDVVYKIISI